MIEKGIMQFSGGKDSTCMLYFLRDLLDRVDVIFSNSGLILPEVLDHIYRTCDRLKANLIEVKPAEDIREFHKREGLPADVVPVEATSLYRDMLHGKVDAPVQSYIACCYNMIMLPAEKYVREHGYNVVMRGSKKCDTRVGVPDGYTDRGVTYLSPIWDWSHEEVFAFLKENNVQLPPHYKFFADSLDCFLCTGHLQHYGAERIRYVRQFHPDKWPELKSRLKSLQEIIGFANKDMSAAIKEGLTDA